MYSKKGNNLSFANHFFSLEEKRIIYSLFKSPIYAKQLELNIYNFNSSNFRQVINSFINEYSLSKSNSLTIIQVMNNIKHLEFSKEVERELFNFLENPSLLLTFPILSQKELLDFTNLNCLKSLKNTYDNNLIKMKLSLNEKEQHSLLFQNEHILKLINNLKPTKK